MTDQSAHVNGFLEALSSDRATKTITMCYIRDDDYLFQSSLLAQDARLFVVEGCQFHFQLQGERDEDGIINCQSVFDRERVGLIEKVPIGSDQLDTLIRYQGREKFNSLL